MEMNGQYGSGGYTVTDSDGNIITGDKRLAQYGRILRSLTKKTLKLNLHQYLLMR